MNRQRQILMFGGLLLALLAAYANHFGNSFHFDDGHAIIDNPAIRSLADVPRFFSDVRTFSVEPTGQSYRPLVTASLALDYALGGGLKPLWFHISTFFWFIVQLILMYALYLYVLERTFPHSQNVWIAWFATAIYALHPASAETLNYIIQRGDLYVSLGMVAGIVLYAAKPGWRSYGLYLLPPLAAMFAKPPAVTFALFLLAYVLLIDRASPVRAIPALVLGAGFLWLEKAMTPPNFFHTSIATTDYWITQPYVTLRYFRSFFLPLHLNVDTDLPAFHSLANPLALAGFLFCTVLIAAAVVTARRTEWRAVSFGLWWFLIGLIPTAIYPLNEVENDHRMFLPFVGLSLAVVGTLGIIVRRSSAVQIRRFAAAGGIVLLAAFAWGTHVRNEVWRTDESLWRDDIEKSPNNARGHDQLGAALDKIPGRTAEAFSEFETAIRVNPDFTNAHVNLGKALSKMPGRLPDAIREFETALRLVPDSAEAHQGLGIALAQTPGRQLDAIQHFETVLRMRPNAAEAHMNLGAALSEVPGRLPQAIAEYETALRLRPDYPEARTNLANARAAAQAHPRDPIADLEEAVRRNPGSADAHTALGIALSQVPKRLPEAISEFRAAVRLNPNSAETHSNLGVALARAPGRLPEALSEFEAAFRIRPDPAVRQTIDNLRAAARN